MQQPIRGKLYRYLNDQIHQPNLMKTVLFDLLGILVTATVSSLLLLGLGSAEGAHLLPEAGFSLTATQWAAYTVLFVLTGALSFLGLSAARQALVRAEHELVERKGIEQALHESEERWQFALEG